MNTEKTYIDIYEQNKELIDKNSARPLNALRLDALENFKRMGFPTRKMENYLYTNLKSQFDYNYGLNFNRALFRFSQDEVFRCNVPGINSHLFFVVNDSFMDGNKSEGQAELKENGIIVGSLREVASSHPDLVSKYLGKAADLTDPMVNFNHIFAQDGFFLYVPKNVKIEKPIQLINLMRADVDLLANSHNLIILEEGSAAKIVVCAHAIDNRKFLCNRATELFLAANASIELYKMESTSDDMINIDQLYVEQAENSSFLLNEMTLQNGLTRNTTRVNLNGENAEVKLLGFSICDKKEHTDNHTTINHNKPRCKSNQLFKYVLDGSATGAFSGKILVAKGAQKTEAYQSNKNICATKNAHIYTKPQLEIYADDVKCSHGASTGQIDENALFYMRARGISEAEAKMLMMLAFTSDVVEQINIEALQNRVRLLVDKRFSGELSKCSVCKSKKIKQ